MYKIKRKPSYISKGDGRDTILLADGLIKIIVTRVDNQEVSISIDCPRDIRITPADRVERIEV